VIIRMPLVRAKPTEAHASTCPASPRTSWLERIRSSIAECGPRLAPIPATTVEPLERARILAGSLLSERGQASIAAVARELLNVLSGLSAEEMAAFIIFVASSFHPATEKLAEAASLYLAEPSARTAALLAHSAEPPRQELLRRINMAEGGTAALLRLRSQLLLLSKHVDIANLDSDLRHLFASWFNRGFLELRRIDWHTPAAILEKLIAYEAVHEIRSWDDLRRRLAPDRRCFAFFHPALSDEPLIFVEVALVWGLADDIHRLLDDASDVAMQKQRAANADTAIFYSISNCQTGLRGISFGSLLIKQVVEELRHEAPRVTTFATLSPIPGFRRWLTAQLNARARDSTDATGSREVRGSLAVSVEPHEMDRLRGILSDRDWHQSAETAAAVRPVLLRACATYLNLSPRGLSKADTVARFHLGNGATLQRLNWLANTSSKGLQESFGLMANYLYDLETIEANHETFVRDGKITASAEMKALLGSRVDSSSLPIARLRNRLSR
jgi:malonyl-CoA decarboxylase